MPVCQDTGMAVVLISLGQEVHLVGAPLKDAVNEGVRRAYEDGKFRKSICDPLTRVNTGDNTPAHLHVEIEEGDKAEITYLPKGFGSENMSRLYMLTPRRRARGHYKRHRGDGTAGGVAALPARICGRGHRRVLRFVRLPCEKGAHPRRGKPQSPAKTLPPSRKRRFNASMRLISGRRASAGRTTAIGVSCELAPTHIAGLPVAVNIQCHCVRCEKEVL